MNDPAEVVMILLNEFLYEAAEMYGYPKDEDGIIDVPDIAPLLDRILEDVASYKDLQNS